MFLKNGLHLSCLSLLYTHRIFALWEFNTSLNTGRGPLATDLCTKHPGLVVLEYFADFKVINCGLQTIWWNVKTYECRQCSVYKYIKVVMKGITKHLPCLTFPTPPTFADTYKRVEFFLSVFYQRFSDFMDL